MSISRHLRIYSIISFDEWYSENTRICLFRVNYSSKSSFNGSQNAVPTSCPVISSSSAWIISGVLILRVVLKMQLVFYFGTVGTENTSCIFIELA